MKKSKSFLLLVLNLIFLISFMPANANCTSTHNLAKEKKDSTKKGKPNSPKDNSSDKLPSLETVIQDLEDVFDLIDEGKKKNAITVLKSAGSEIRKVKGLNSSIIKDLGKKIQRAVNLLKKEKEDEALDLIDEILNQLSDVQDNNADDFSNEEDEEDFDDL